MVFFMRKPGFNGSSSVLPCAPTIPPPQLLHEMAAASPVDHSVLHATTVTGVVAAHAAGPHVPLHAPTGALGAPAGAHKPHGLPAHNPSRSGSMNMEERTLVDWIHTVSWYTKGLGISKSAPLLVIDLPPISAL